MAESVPIKPKPGLTPVICVFSYSYFIWRCYGTTTETAIIHE